MAVGDRLDLDGCVERTSGCLTMNGADAGTSLDKVETSASELNPSATSLRKTATSEG